VSDALEIASHIFSGETSAVQVMWETVERVRCLDRRFHAVCNLQQDIGFEQAERIDAWLGQLSEVKRRTVQHTQPFLGVPSLLKDLGTAAWRMRAMALDRSASRRPAAA
jgi:amidase